jgi:hypothetical protein
MKNKKKMKKIHKLSSSSISNKDIKNLNLAFLKPFFAVKICLRLKKKKKEKKK